MSAQDLFTSFNEKKKTMPNSYYFSSLKSTTANKLCLFFCQKHIFLFIIIVIANKSVFIATQKIERHTNHFQTGNVPQITNILIINQTTFENKYTTNFPALLRYIPDYPFARPKEVT